MALALLRGQLPILAQFPGQVRVGFWFLWGFTLGHGLGSFAGFQVISRVDPTHWVSLARDFGLPLPVSVIDGSYELTDIPQGNRPIVVHHLVFDTAS